MTRLLDKVIYAPTHFTKKAQQALRDAELERRALKQSIRQEKRNGPLQRRPERGR